MSRSTGVCTVIGVDEGQSLPLTQRLTPRHWVAIDIGIAVILAAVSVLATALETSREPSGAGWSVVRYLAILVACLPLSVRRRDPVRALYVMAPAVAVVVALAARGPTLIPAAAVAYTVAATAARRTSFTGTCAVVGAIVLGAMLAPGGPAWAGVLALPPVVIVGWLAGENAKARRSYAQGQAAGAAERERERADRARRAVADERLRIARDLHDIVAHAMSVIAIRSGVARLVIDTQPDEAREALSIIETTSRRALAEMRLLVGVLRQPEDTAELGPAPGLADLPDLIDYVRQAGVRVDLDSESEAPTLPAGVDLSAYRIVQEALTNVVRHAGPTTVHVTLRQRHDQLEIEVVDDGAPAGRVAVLAPDGEGRGHGLVGMRERVSLFGGDLSAAPAGRGFRVFARLPFDEATR